MSIQYEVCTVLAILGSDPVKKMCICKNYHGEQEKLSEKQYFRVKDEVLIPFVKKKFEPEISLESILVGPKNNSDLAVKGLKYFFRNKKMNINISKSEIPLRY